MNQTNPSIPSSSETSPPLGLSENEWNTFQGIIASTRQENPTLQYQKLIRKVVTRFQEIVPTTTLRTRFAQDYINELRNARLLEYKTPNKKVYTDETGRKWQYMNREQIVEFFLSKSKKETLVRSVREHGGIFPGYAVFAQKQNKRLAHPREKEYLQLPKTYKTLVGVMVGSEEKLSADMLQHIGLTKERISFLLRPERSRILAKAKDLESTAVREFLVNELSYGGWKGMEFRTALLRAIRRWNQDKGRHQEFTLPIQINNCTSGASWQSILNLPNIQWKTLFARLNLPEEVWIDKEYYIRPYFHFLQSGKWFEGKGEGVFARGLELSDFDIKDGIFIYTAQGRTKYKNSVDIEALQMALDEFELNQKRI